MAKKSRSSRLVNPELPAEGSAPKGFFSRLPKRVVTSFLVLGIVFALTMYQANRPIRSVTAEVGQRRIQIDLREKNGVVFGAAVEGTKATETAVAALAPDKAAATGLPLVKEQQLRDAAMSTDPATGACLFTIGPGQTIGFDPKTFTWRSRFVQQ